MCHIIRPLSPIKSPTVLKKKQTHSKPKFYVMHNDSSDNLKVQEDSVFFSSSKSVLSNKYYVGPNSTDSEDIISSNYLLSEVSKKLKTKDQAMGESVCFPSFLSPLIKSSKIEEMKKPAKTDSNLPGDSSSSESWGKFEVTVPSKNLFNSTTSVTSLYDHERENDIKSENLINSSPSLTIAGSSTVQIKCLESLVSSGHKIEKFECKDSKQPNSTFNISKHQSTRLLSKNASFLPSPLQSNKRSKDINSKKEKSLKRFPRKINLLSDKSCVAYLSKVENCTDVQPFSKSKQSLKKPFVYLDQSKKTEFSASRLKSMLKIEKILSWRKNANSNNSIRKPKWMTKSKSNKISVVNDVSPSKLVSNLESKSEVNDQSLSEGSPIENESENYNVKNPHFEASEYEDEPPSVFSDPSDSLLGKKCCNYVRRKWRRPVRKNLSESVPKVIASGFRNLKLSLTQAYKVLERKKALTDAFKDRSVSPETESIVFYVLKYFSLLEKYNPVRDFKRQPDPSLFLSPFEEHVISILFDLETTEERFKDLILSIVVNVRQLILAVNNLSLNASCALCRIYTLICKSKANNREAISFCCDILKIKHKFGPMLIATIVGVWNDLVDVSYDMAEDEVVFYGCLCLKAQQWGGVESRSKGLSLSDWEISKCILEKYTSATPVKPNEDTVDFLVESIREKCIKETYAKEYMLTTSLVLLAAYCGWHWAKVNIVDKYLVPYIGSCIDSAKYARALTLFCRLYAEISLFYPLKDLPEKILYELFEVGKEDKENKFMQEAAAPALIQLLLSRNKPLSQDLLDWYEKNQSNHAFIFLKFYFHRQSLSNKTDFTEADIL